MALTHPFTVACAAACLAWAARADVRTVKTVATYLDGRQEQRTYSVSQEGRTATLIISAAEVGAGVKTLDVIPSFARTRTGEAGYFLTPDGILGRFHETNGVFSVNKGDDLHEFCADTGGTTELLFLYRKAISVFSSFMDIYENVLPAETYLYIKNTENTPTAISTCSFSDIKTFYQDAYEALGNLLFLPVCLDNIVLRKNHNSFEKAYKSVKCYSCARDLSWFRTLNNGTRINRYNNKEVFQQLINLPANRLLRNGIGHNNVKYDGVTQIITAYDQKEPEKVTVEMSLMDMAIDCIGMAKAAVILSEMILFLLREEFRRENITTIIHPRFYKNREPNAKCPCGSFINFKKCCKNDIDSLVD